MLARPRALSARPPLPAHDSLIIYVKMSYNTMQTIDQNLLYLKPEFLSDVLKSAKELISKVIKSIVNVLTHPLKD
jgi:hypothetical protein